MERTYAQLMAATGENESLWASLVEDQIAVLRLNRPASRNALNAELTVRLAEAVRVVENDPRINLGILAGVGSTFCAGADLKEVLSGGLEKLFTDDGGLGGFTHADRAKPWIAAVEGAALAGGFELALSCDLVLASRSAIFGLPEVKRGLMASAGGIYRLPRSVSRSLALEMIATGEPISAELAHSAGLVNRVVEDGKALEGAIELGRVICANAPLAVRESLAIARRAFDGSDTSLYELGDEAQNRLKLTADFAEGSRAFVEKRAPKWRGC